MERTHLPLAIKAGKDHGRRFIGVLHLRDRQLSFHITLEFCSLSMVSPDTTKGRITKPLSTLPLPAVFLERHYTIEHDIVFGAVCVHSLYRDMLGVDSHNRGNRILVTHKVCNPHGLEPDAFWPTTTIAAFYLGPRSTTAYLIESGINKCC